MLAASWDIESKRIGDILETTSETEHSWNQINDTLVRLEKLIRDNCSKSSFVSGAGTPFSALLKRLKDPLINSLLSERTKLSGTAVNLVIAIACLENNEISCIADWLIPALLKLCTRANRVMVTRANNCLKEMVVHNKSILKWIPKMVEAFDNPNKGLRLIIAGLLVVALESYSSADLVDYQPILQVFIKNALQDASVDVRDTARKLFSRYQGHFPAEALELRQGMSSTMQKYLKDVPVPRKPFAERSNQCNATPTSPVVQRLNVLHVESTKKGFASLLTSTKRKDVVEKSLDNVSSLPCNPVPVAPSTETLNKPPLEPLWQKGKPRSLLRGMAGKASRSETVKPLTEKAASRSTMTEKPLTEKAASRSAMNEKPFTEKAASRSAMTEKPLTEKAASRSAINEMPLTEKASSRSSVTENPLAEKAASSSETVNPMPEKSAMTEKIASSKTAAVSKPNPYLGTGGMKRGLGPRDPFASSKRQKLKKVSEESPVKPSITRQIHEKDLDSHEWAVRQSVFSNLDSSKLKLPTLLAIFSKGLKDTHFRVVQESLASLLVLEKEDPRLFQPENLTCTVEALLPRLFAIKTNTVFKTKISILSTCENLCQMLKEKVRDSIDNSSALQNPWLAHLLSAFALDYPHNPKCKSSIMESIANEFDINVWGLDDVKLIISKFDGYLTDRECFADALMETNFKRMIKLVMLSDKVKEYLAVHADKAYFAKILAICQVDLLGLRNEINLAAIEDGSRRLEKSESDQVVDLIESLELEGGNVLSMDDLAVSDEDDCDNDSHAAAVAATLVETAIKSAVEEVILDLKVDTLVTDLLESLVVDDEANVDDEVEVDDDDEVEVDDDEVEVDDDVEEVDVDDEASLILSELNQQSPANVILKELHQQSPATRILNHQSPAICRLSADQIISPLHSEASVILNDEKIDLLSPQKLFVSKDDVVLDNDISNLLDALSMETPKRSVGYYENVESPSLFSPQPVIKSAINRNALLAKTIVDSIIHDAIVGYRKNHDIEDQVGKFINDMIDTLE